MKLWAGRFQKETDYLVNDFNSSIQFDFRLYEEDIKGSIAHATMLGETGIIAKEEASKIVAGLKQILLDIEDKKIEFSIENEDIHMNVEQPFDRAYRGYRQKAAYGAQPGTIKWRWISGFI